MKPKRQHDMPKKLAKFALLFVLLFIATVVTTVDHLLIGFVIFIAMIVMVATGPKAGEHDELSEMAQARKKSQSLN